MRCFLITLMLIGIASSAFAMSNLPLPAAINDLMGKQSPEFTLETIFGKTQSLTQARAGKKTMLFFWATWCPHCQEELETVKQQIGIIKAKGIQIVLVDVGENKEDAKSFLERQQIALDSFIDEDNTVAGRYSVVGIPTVFLIDEQGILRAVEHGFPTDYDSRFDS